MDERMPDAADGLMVFSPSSRAILYVNAPAVELLGMGEDELLVHDADEILPELADITPRSFTAQRPGGRVLAVRLEPLRTGPFMRTNAMAAILAPERSATAASAEPAVNGSEVARLQSLWTLAMSADNQDDEYAATVVCEGARALGLQWGMIEHAGDDGPVVDVAGAADGDGVPPVEARDALAGLRPTGSAAFAIGDFAADAEFSAQHPAIVAAGVRAVIAAAFATAGVNCTIVFWSNEPRPRGFSVGDRRYVAMICDALAQFVVRRQTDAQMKQLAYSDELTGLPNRVALFERIEEVLAAAERHAQRSAVLFLDMDGFKAVNDTVGHPAGDRVLAEIAQRIRGTLRRSEFVGRLGGDEFAVVLPQISTKDEIDQVVRRIASVMAEPVKTNGYRFALSASIGVAVYPGDGTTREELLARADAAMYAAKTAGRSRVHYTDPAREFNAIVGMIGGDEEPDATEVGYLLCYQPIVDLATKRVDAAEAFVRRVHPLHGLLAPERILTTVRDQAARQALDRWVLREAATQARAWQLAGKPVRVAVNLAAFDPATFDEMLGDEAHLIDFANLAIELEASQLQGDPDVIARFAASCRARGMTINVTRFDGGFGALSQFADLPIDMIKIDRKLVDRIAISRTAQAVARGTVLVAKSLGWRVIAQGVEGSAQRELLTTLGCDGLQGFWLAYPMTAHDFTSWLSIRSAAATAV